MKQCAGFELLSAEVDGAIDELEARALHDHIESCARCRTVRAELLLLKAAVRDRSPKGSAPETLKQRLAARVKRRRMQKRGAIFAAAIVATAMLFMLTPRPRELAAQLVGDHVLMTLDGATPLEVRGEDLPAIERWFAGKLDFALRLPALPGARIIGGRLCSIAGRRVALTFYEKDGRRLSLFVMDGAGARGEGCEAMRGFTVCHAPARGVEYALVTDLTAAQANLLLRGGMDDLQ
jgi:anti-sigma factor RsiW